MLYTSENAQNSLAKHGVRSEGGPGDKNEKKNAKKKKKKVKTRTVSMVDPKTGKKVSF